MVTYSFLLAALCVHLVYDLHKEDVKKPIVHWLSALLAVVVSILFGYINQKLTHVCWWQFAIYSLAIHFALFDYAWNFFNHKPLFYHGTPSNPDRAWSDKMWTRIPPGGELLFRIIGLLAGYGVYSHLDWILKGYGK